MASQKSGVRGYAFLIMMMMVTILLISLTAALPSIYAEGQREKEEELIFRGREYARAILLYRRQFGRFPTSVKDMLKKTNGFRFLRHAYTDPMTASGKWRFIHANAAGMLIDSKTTPTMGGPGRPNSPNPSNPNSPQGGQGTSGFQLSPGMQPGPQTTGGPGIPNSSSTTDVSTGTSTSTDKDSGSSTSSASGTMAGGFIAGVASTSHKSSFRVLNNHTRYDEWEFLGIDQSANAILSPGGTGNQPGQPSSPGSSSPSNSTPPGQNTGQGGTSQPTSPQNPPE